jgi:hypothetical protein
MLKVKNEEVCEFLCTVFVFNTSPLWDEVWCSFKLFCLCIFWSARIYFIYKSYAVELPFLSCLLPGLIGVSG